MRRFLLTFALVVAGFVAGMVITGRLRVASDSLADPAVGAKTAPALTTPEQVLAALDRHLAVSA